MSSSKFSTIAILGLPINHRGQYLLALRNDPKNPKTHRKWEIIGGGLEHGESFEQCLLREVEEEIGVIPNIITKRPIIYSGMSQIGTPRHIILACYLISLQNIIPAPNHREILEVKWFFPEEIIRLDSLPHTTFFIRKAQKIHIHNRKKLATIQSTGEGKQSAT